MMYVYDVCIQIYRNITLLLIKTNLYMRNGACPFPRAEKGQQKLPTLKKTTGLCPSMLNYSMDGSKTVAWMKCAGVKTSPHDQLISHVSLVCHATVRKK